MFLKEPPLRLKNWIVQRNKVVKEISKDEFCAKLNSDFVFEENPHVGICLSGGPDSMALLLLMKDWVKSQNGKITVFHFNHGIREESAHEALLIHNIVRKMGIKCHVLSWKRESKEKINMKTARDIRYKMILENCKKLKIIHLMTAHHYDDNLETYFMRNKRKYCSLGLSGIPKSFITENVEIVRPLLSFSKQRLIATCKFNKIEWLNDYNNKNNLYERPRIRKELSKKNKTELKKLSQQLELRKKKNDEIEIKIKDFFYKNIRFHDFGVFEINKKCFLETDQLIQCEIIKKILTTTSGAIYPPRIKSIKRLIKSLRINDLKRSTLHSCYIVNGDSIKIYKEVLRNNEELICIPKRTPYLWDNRFFIYSHKFNLRCSNINEKSWLEIKRLFCLKKPTINFSILQSLPLIRVSKLITIPFLVNNHFLNKFGLEFYFKPTICLSRKNFF